MQRDYENKFAYFRISNEIVILEIKDDVVLNLNVAIVITSDSLFLQENKEYNILLDVDKLSDTDKAGRDYLARYGWFLSKRVGILARSFNAATIAKFYLRLSKPCVNTRIFDDKEKALRFLSGCID